MAVEIERKFLVKDPSCTEQVEGVHYKQGYLSSDERATVRVRVAGDSAWLTIKSKSDGIKRSEYEYAIPRDEANQMLDSLCDGPIIDKVRYKIPAAPHTWEVDVFAGANQGLIVAEIELTSEDEHFDRPAWLGREVSDEQRYFNSQLARHPYSNWQD